MQRFCTLFNSFYLSRGLAMYRSLLSQTSDFHLYIFAFDDACFEILVKLQLSNATIISLVEFETKELLAVKGSRTVGEYCWTCTAFTISYCINRFSLDHCTYIDADLMFYRNPEILMDEMGDDSVLITEHRYSPEYDQSKTSGIYCVQFVTFKNTDQGRLVLDWWESACLEWCYNRFEDGKFGDQKYLDDWTSRFEGVHVLGHLGGGVAPWNSKEYSFYNTDDEILIVDSSEVKSPLIFYHFHDFRFCESNCIRLTSEQYLIREDAIKTLYIPYVKALENSERDLRKVDPLCVCHEKLLSLKWVKVSFSRFIHFTLKGYSKSYYRRDKLAKLERN